MEKRQLRNFVSATGPISFGIKHTSLHDTAIIRM